MVVTLNRCLLCMFLLAVIASCVIASPAVYDEVSVAGRTLILVEYDGRCRLQFGSASLYPVVLEPRPPCHFLRNEHGAPQAFAYEDQGIENVLVVVGTPLSEPKRSEWGIDKDAICGEEAQGILITVADIKASDTTLNEVVLCRDYGADEKVFWHFAHH